MRDNDDFSTILEAYKYKCQFEPRCASTVYFLSMLQSCATVWKFRRQVDILVFQLIQRRVFSMKQTRDQRLVEVLPYLRLHFRDRYQKHAVSQVDNDNYRDWGVRIKDPEVAKWYGQPCLQGLNCHSSVRTVQELHSSILLNQATQLKLLCCGCQQLHPSVCG